MTPVDDSATTVEIPRLPPRRFGFLAVIADNPSTTHTVVVSSAQLARTWLLTVHTTVMTVISINSLRLKE